MVRNNESTCWTVIEAAAAGGSKERDYFANRYGPTIRAYLSARWKSSLNRGEIDDAIQEVFIECFKQGGLLSKADRDKGSGFRTFLFAATRNVALRIESKRARQREKQPGGDVELDQVVEDDSNLSAIFDKAWVASLLQEAAARQKSRAEEKGDKAVKRVELLRLRFEEGLPIRDIAKLWQTEAAALHHEYARARQEFKEALLDVVSFHHPGTADEVEQECVRLVAMLG